MLSLCLCLSICCLSHGSIVLKQLNVLSCKLRHSPFKGDSSSVCLMYSTGVQNLITLATAVPEIWLVPTKIQMVHG